VIRAIVAALLLGGSAHAQSADFSALYGRWQIDPAQTHMGRFGPNGHNIVRSDTFSLAFEAEGDHAVVEVYDRFPQDRPTRVTAMIADGQVHPCTDSVTCNTLGGSPGEQSYRYFAIDPRFFMRVFFVKGVATEYSTYQVSADGRTFTMIAWSAATPYWQNVQVFTRQPDMGPRFPGDYPLPPAAWMLHPNGPAPNGRPPEVSDDLRPDEALASLGAHAALQACQVQGLKVGVAVLDAGGDLRYAIAADGMPPGRIYIAIRKGLGALEFKVPTSRIAAITDADPSQLRRLQPGMAAFPGGVPLIVKGKLYGAIAASGAKAAQDEACAQAGAAAILAKLN
jgi:uncharacterized protein GlcG (DUF336 family)